MLFRQKLLPILLPPVILSRFVQRFAQANGQTDKHDLFIRVVLWRIFQRKRITLLCLYGIGGQTFVLSYLLQKTENVSRSPTVRDVSTLGKLCKEMQNGVITSNMRKYHFFISKN